MTSTVSKSQLKLQMIEVCISKQQALINDFNDRIKLLLEPEGLGNEESYDNSTQGTKSRNAEEINALTEELEFAAQEMNILEFLRTQNDRESKKAELGAVVITTDKSFFISVSAERFAVEGQEYFGLSAHSPLFLAMRGRRKGEKFQYNHKTYEIIDVY